MNPTEQAYTELMEDTHQCWAFVAAFTRNACAQDARLFKTVSDAIMRLVELCELCEQRRLLDPAFQRFATRWLQEHTPPPNVPAQPVRPTQARTSKRQASQTTRRGRR